MKGAWTALYHIQEHAESLRLTYLEELAAFKAEQYGTTSGAEIKKLIHIEEVRKTARKHGWYLKEHRKGMVDHVLIPTFNISAVPALMFFLMTPYWVAFLGLEHCTPSHKGHLYGFSLLALCWLVQVQQWHIQSDWVRVSDPATLFHEILERNKHQLLKSLPSPFATSPLADAIGRDGSGPCTKQILDGTIDTDCISSIDPSIEMRHFIQALQRPISKKTGSPIPPFEYALDSEVYRAIFQKATESTASSPSRIHYGHYIAAMQDDVLTAVNAVFMRVPFKHGFPLERWSSSVQCMLQKKNKPYIIKLRIIELFEADFNSGLKYILGRQLLYHSETHGINSNQTHGSRPGRSTHDALTITKLTYDIARLDKVNIVSIFNDAAGCYDRMRHNLMTVSSERMGCPDEVALCLARVLNQMKHHAQTANGISEAFIQACARLNLGGAGQGNGGGPISWHSHMEPLLLAYTKLNAGFSFEDPTQLLQFVQWIVGYVDDNSLILTFRDGQSSQEAMLEAQAALTSWKNLLQITGGDLALEKCVYSYMGWKKEKGAEVLGSMADLPGSIQIESTEGEAPVTIKRIEAWDAERILGVMCSLEGGDDTELQYRIQQAVLLAGRIKQSPLSRFDAEIVYRERWMSTIKYCLPITRFTPHQCHQVTKIVEQAILPKLGFNRHMPKAVLYDPKLYGGKQLMNTHTEQTILHLETFMAHIRGGDDIGTL